MFPETAIFIYNPENPEMCDSWYKLSLIFDETRPEYTAPWIWAGNGLSMAVGYPSSKELAREMKVLLPPSTRAILNGTETYEQIADLVYEKCGEGTLISFIDGIFRRCADKRPTRTHELIARIRWGQMITTNYDALLEDTWAMMYGVRPVSVFEEKFIQNADQEFHIWKIHGDGKNWRDIILSGRSYQQYLESYPYLVRMLEEGFLRTPVIFIGCSMTDERIYSVLRSIRAKGQSSLVRGGVYMVRHDDYQAIPPERVEILAENFIFPLIIDDYQQIDSILAKFAKFGRGWMEVFLDQDLCFRDGRFE